MSRRDAFDVVVVGAGVVGAAAALAFARDGLGVALVEAREPPRWRPESADLRVYAFAPDNAMLLENLGVWREVREARVQPYRAMRVWDAAGGRELVFDADSLARRELGWIVENDLLVDRLWRGLPTAGVQVLCPERVQALSQDDDFVFLELEGGRRLRTRYAVAADGAQSQLRTLVGIETEGRDYGQRGLVAFVETEHPHEATCWQRFLPGGPLALLPFADAPDTSDDRRGRHGSIVWSLPEAEAARLLAVDAPTFLREFELAFGGRLGRALSVSSRAAFPLRRQLAQSCAAGRVLVIGDAAHVVHPLAGQGVNLGLRDAAALREMLAPMARGGDAPSRARLRRWERERRSGNTAAAYAFEGIHRLFSNDALVPTLVRGPLLGLAGRLPPLVHAFWRHAAGL